MKRSFIILSAALTASACGVSSLPQIPKGQAPHEYKNVVVHDPSILKAGDGYYYVNGSDMCGARTSDLIDWEQISKDIRYDEPSWFADTRGELKDVMAWGHTRTFWASSLIRLKSGPYAGKYMFDYCVCQGGCPQAAIGYAWRTSLKALTRIWGFSSILSDPGGRTTSMTRRRSRSCGPEKEAT